MTWEGTPQGARGRSGAPIPPHTSFGWLCSCKRVAGWLGSSVACWVEVAGWGWMGGLGRNISF